MCTYPEPVDPIVDWQTERAVLQTNPNGPELSDLLEVQRRMMRIPVQYPVILLCKITNVGR
jgi:hypothetical protein